MLQTRCFLLVACFGLAFLGEVQPVRACEKPKKVRVTVVVILASETSTEVDKRLADIAREVRRTNPKLTGFKYADMAWKSLAVGTKDKFKLIADQEVEVTVRKGSDPKDKVEIKIAPPSMGEITYSTPCGKFLPIITKFRTKKNDLLIIAVRVQPCKGK
jgi:hypothetical protein